MMYDLAYYFRKDFSFGESRAKNLNLAKAFSVKKYPQLIAIVPAKLGEEKYNEEYGMIRYNGEIKKKNIIKWLENIKKAMKAAATTSGARQRRKTEL
jgi:hypothetical protein